MIAVICLFSMSASQLAVLVFIILYICSTYCACFAPKVLFLVCEYLLLILLLISAIHLGSFGGLNNLVIKEIRSHLIIIIVTSSKSVSLKT